MATDQEMEKMKMRQNYHNHWAVDLMHTPSVDPAYCCFSVWCAPCASYMLRKRVLYGDMRRYTCCGGYMPCSGKCHEQKCPEFCLGTEVFCCFSSSVATTRFLLQDEFNIQTTKCDNCIIGFMFVLQQLACICTIIACLTGEEGLSDLAQCLNCLSDTVQCTVCACMLTQHKLELDKRDGITDAFPPMQAPAVQQMSRVDPNTPPPVAGHPPPVAGHPPPVAGHPSPVAGHPPPVAGNPPPPVIVDGYPAPQQKV